MQKHPCLHTRGEAEGSKRGMLLLMAVTSACHSLGRPQIEREALYLKLWDQIDNRKKSELMSTNFISNKVSNQETIQSQMRYRQFK